MDQPPTGAVLVHVFGRTDVGRTREHNEDAFMIADLSSRGLTPPPGVRTHEVGERGTLFMVADGMGGAAAGEIASAMAVDVVLRELKEHWTHSDASGAEPFAAALRAATAAANAQIHAFAGEHPEYHGMGTTATVAGLLDDTLFLAQVGDSRAYLVRDGIAAQITKDQSLTQKLIEAGELTEEEAAHSERRNIILQALGPEPSVKVDLTHQQVRRGDLLVLCSDGLSGQIRADEIGAVVAGEPDLEEASRRLIDMANERGGPDNITVIIARFEGPGLAAARATDEVGHRVYSIAGGVPTPATPMQAIPAAPRGVGIDEEGARPVLDDLALADLSESSLEPIETLAPPAAMVPPIPPGRRSRGMLIATILLLILLGGAAFMVYRMAMRVIPASGTTSDSARTQ